MTKTIDEVSKFQHPAQNSPHHMDPVIGLGVCFFTKEKCCIDKVSAIQVK
jgi:hypothetical protein